MKPGPKSGTGAASNGDTRTFVEKAGEAWQEAPDWVLELALQADKNRLSGAAKALGYTGSLVSQVINNKYPGDLRRVEEMVRGAFMASVVDCPVLGEIGRNRCLVEQKEGFRATSAMRAQLYHACRQGCPHSHHTKSEGGSNE